MFKEWLDVLVGPVHAIFTLGLISQSEYSILQVSKSKDCASALGGQYSEQKTMPKINVPCTIVTTRKRWSGCDWQICTIDLCGQAW